MWAIEYVSLLRLDYKSLCRFCLGHFYALLGHWHWGKPSVTVMLSQCHSHVVSGPMENFVCKELRPPANSSMSELGSWSSSLAKLSDDYSIIHILTATLWETLSQNHPVYPISDSWFSETLWDNNKCFVFKLLSCREKYVLPCYRYWTITHSLVTRICKLKRLWNIIV